MTTSLFRTVLLAAPLAALLLAGSGATAQAQTALPPDDTAPSLRLSAHVSAGYTSFSMNEATDFFRLVIGAYQSQGINIPVQQTYPGNLLYGGEVVLDGEPGWMVSVGTQYARSEAAALYGDVGGTLDVTSETSVWVVESTASLLLRRDRRVQPYVGVGSGLAIARYDVEETLRLSFGGSQNVSSAQLTAKGNGYSVTGFGGVRYVLRPPVSLRAQAGYRHATVGNDEDEFPFNLGYSGPVASLGLEVGLWTWR
jgi:opacity protein-like surface antigen